MKPVLAILIVLLMFASAITAVTLLLYQLGAFG